MDTNVPMALPDEQYKLSPESLDVINTYLSCMNVSETAETLGVPRQDVVEYLNKHEVKRFINTVFLDSGYANQFKLQDIMDKAIASKLEEIEETDIYSSKDLMDILALQHKMRMDHMDRMIKLEEAKNKGPANQTNVQVNSYGDNFSSLLDKLVSNELPN